MGKRRVRSISASIVGLGLVTVTALAGSVAPAAATVKASLSKSVIKVEVNTGLSGEYPYPEDVTGAQAAAKAINASGGIQGHKLEVVSCDGQSVTDPNPTIACAQNEVADSAVLADVGNYSGFGGVSLPIFQKANLASIGDAPFSAQQYSLDDSFPFIGFEGEGTAVILADHGAKKPVFATVELAEDQQATQLANAILEKSRGIKLGGSVPVPLTETDITPQVTQAASEGDGVAMNITPQQTTQFVVGVSQGGLSSKLKLAMAALNATPAEIKSFGSAANGVYVESSLPLVTSNVSGIKLYRAQMNAVDSKAIKDEISLNSWLATWAFAQVARKLPAARLTRVGVLNAFNHLTNFNVFGLLPPNYTTTKPSAMGIPGLNRVFNVYSYYGEIEHGVVTPISNGPVALLKKG
jgi:branched-chain amino acid transport system substrate-binding protein